MAKCKLDIDEPNISINGNASQSDLREGLETLRDKVAKDHNISMWFSHPLPRFPEYSNKVWEWDFKPTGDRSYTRPGWRLLAYVPNPEGPEPILARPFVCWDKSKAPTGNQAKFIAKALKKFLSERVQITVEEDVFTRTVDRQGKHISTCQLCWEHVESLDGDELEILEVTHKDECRRHPPD